ncbi:MAG: PASTA domain-containing protein [Gammaproteobacteria bacterium]|nr:PASTA domain-containing protein [Gammaproteobacteria bacterium]
MLAKRKVIWAVTILFLIQAAACSSGGGGDEPTPPPARIAVPDVTGLDRTTAESNIVSAGLTVGTITNQSSDTVPSGDVISQNPASTSMVNAGSAVNLVISTGPANIAVPDVVGRSQAQATTDINAAGLVVGTITQQNDNNAPVGDVIGQDPVSATMVSAGTAVNLIVSSGPANIAVPNVVGLSQAQATTAINAAGLVVGTVTQQNDNNVPIGDIISQDPVSATMVSAGSAVDLVVSTGPATIAVPDVVGLSQAQATTDINAAGLVVGTVTQQNDNNVPVGNVISQDPVSATLVSAGSAVDLLISNGPAANVAVPNVIGLSQAQATTDINTAGLVVGTVTQQNDNNVPLGNVISQNPVAATLVVPGSAVDLTISQGPAATTFSDEFNADSLNEWSLRHVVEGTAAQYTTLDINQSTAGRLTIIPTLTPGWFDDGDAPLIFKMLTGNFAVHVRVLADSVSNPGQPPGSDFNSAGLLARNPAGATGPENYIMLNTGRQDGRIATRVGSETKTTVNSNSTLFLDQGANFGELILCRIGDNFHSFRFLDGDAGWSQTDVFARPDLPNTLQVGMVALSFGAPPDLRAEFDFIRLRPTPSIPTDCTP